jgi:hypothetical protein
MDDLFNSSNFTGFDSLTDSNFYKNIGARSVAQFVANPISIICFPAKTPIQTDQGFVNIDEINPSIHTIRKRKIVGITRTVTQEKHLVCFEKDSLGVNLPSQKTIITKNHCILYRGKMMKAKEFVGLNNGIYLKKYRGDILYNVLMEEHDKMIVNNLICETLHPNNSIAKLYVMLLNMSPENQQKYIEKYNEVIIKKKVYASNK